MKKQILILLMAIFAISYSTSAFGQDVLTGEAVCPTVTALAGCGDTDPLHPQYGILYDYTVTVPAPFTDPTFNWFVTTDKQFINPAPTIEDATGDYILTEGIGYNDPSTGLATIEMSWKYWVHDPENPVFLVIYVTGGTTDACQNDNIQVYIIEPRHSFTLDMQSIALDGTASSTGPCAADVTSAEWNYNGGSPIVNMDYGVNYLFFTVIAANFHQTWLPRFDVDLGATYAGSRTVTAVEYTTGDGSSTSTWVPSTYNATNGWVANTAVDVGDNTIGIGGHCIIVRVTVDNDRDPTLAAQTITVSVDGNLAETDGTFDFTNTALADLNQTNCTPQLFDDSADQTIEPRPTINNATPGGAFETKDDL